MSGQDDRRMRPESIGQGMTPDLERVSGGGAIYSESRGTPKNYNFFYPYMCISVCYIRVYNNKYPTAQKYIKNFEIKIK